MRSSRAAIAAALPLLVPGPRRLLVRRLAVPATTAAATPQASATTNAAHKPVNTPENLKVLDGITVSGDQRSRRS